KQRGSGAKLNGDGYLPSILSALQSSHRAGAGILLQLQPTSGPARANLPLLPQFQDPDAGQVFTGNCGRKGAAHAGRRAGLPRMRHLLVMLAAEPFRWR
ncbi:MAG TPA: hypothetical protein VEH27_07660, partial [Methylomirabilota bacterium]|nr:hypothetical protein [Methylomirabilota bacterium]